MYTEEELEGLQQENDKMNDKLLRENEKLKKSLEKERFFNKLLDQEIKDLKADISNRLPVGYTPEKTGVSKGAFYTVLIIMLAMAGYIFYTDFYNPGTGGPSTASAPAQEPLIKELPSSEQAEGSASASDSVPDIVMNKTGGNSSPSAQSPSNSALKSQPADAAKDRASSRAPTKASTTGVPVDDDRSIVPSEKANTRQPENTTANNPNRPGTGASAPTASSANLTKNPGNKLPAPSSRQANDGNDAKQLANTTVTPAAGSTAVAPPPTPARQAIATYRVSSKANFYTAPDENALGRTFISGGNKTVKAYEDQNGFIYVEYVNERGLMTKGWLSKKDLTKE